MQPILSVKMPIKKFKGAEHQCYNDGDGVVRCEQTLRASRINCKQNPRNRN